jgi:uncharacterized membrane protein
MTANQPAALASSLQRPASTRPRAGSRGGWLVPLGLVALSAIPLTAGTLRLVQLAGGPQLMPADSRFTVSPIPVVVHIIGAAVYALVGIGQLMPRLRRSHLRWHRRAGRVVATAGLLVAASALWMTLFYPAEPGSGPLLLVLRVAFGSAMITSLVLGFTAIRRRDVAAHRAWMIRAYAIGLGAGTQAFTEGIAIGVFDTGVITSDLAKGTAWIINLAIAEWIIRRPKPLRPRTGNDARRQRRRARTLLTVTNQPTGGAA